MESTKGNVDIKSFPLVLKVRQTAAEEAFDELTEYAMSDGYNRHQIPQIRDWTERYESITDSNIPPGIVVETPPFNILSFTDSTNVALPAVLCCPRKSIATTLFLYAHGQFLSYTIKNFT